MKMYALEASRLPNTTSTGTLVGFPCKMMEAPGTSTGGGNKTNLAIVGKQLNKAIGEVCNRVFNVKVDFKKKNEILQDKYFVQKVIRLHTSLQKASEIPIYTNYVFFEAFLPVEQ